MGLGQFGLTGGSPDTFFKDIRFQSGIAGARLEQYQTDMVQEMSQRREMSYLDYLARNSQITPVSGPSILELGTDIASAGLGYYKDPTRMRSVNNDFATGTLHNFGYSGRASVGDYI